MCTIGCGSLNLNGLTEPLQLALAAAATAGRLVALGRVKVKPVQGLERHAIHLRRMPSLEF
jgi:hypothetical protein